MSLLIARDSAVSAGMSPSFRHRLTIGLAVDEAPQVVVEALELEHALCVVDRRFDLEPVPDDRGIRKQALDVTLA